ncbi:unnamed protein product [Ostreobium quekettii]|uniref:F-box/LRR-repeat protein 15-like leucin rich repeat domain-containing protein n=1 Tax=Ostreobium quekettii TaxID=121088 RepID=A0A8S1J2B7_9CHLO|nr:unnamed protein product [Ostreobium quekettii]
METDGARQEGVDWTRMPPHALRRVVAISGRGTVAALRQSCWHFCTAVGEACRELDPRVFDGKTIGCRFPCLERLNISCCGQVLGSGLSHIGNLRHLHTLNIGSTVLSLASVNALASFCGTLTNLDIHDARNVDDDCIGELSKLTKLKVLNISGLRDVTDIGFSALIRTLSNLRRLEMQWAGITDDAFPALALGATQLEHLDISFNRHLLGHKFRSLQMLPTLRHLSLDNNPHLTDEAMIWIAGIQSLESLSLNWEREFGEGLSAFCSSHGRPLHSLSIRTSSVLDAVCAFSLLKLEGLTALQLHGFAWSSNELRAMCECNGLVGLTLLEISMGKQHVSSQSVDMSCITTFTALKHLSLNWCGDLKDGNLKKFARSLTCLRTLCIPQSPCITNVGVAHLSRLSGLEVLDLSHNRKINNRGLKKLSRTTSLRDLSLKGLYITDTALFAMKSLKRLERLDVGGCSDITACGIMSLTRLENLKVLSMQWCSGLSRSEDLESQLLRRSRSVGLVVEREPVLPNMDFPSGRSVSDESVDYG